jgi:hypothetical protein
MSNVGEVLLADLSTHELALRAAQGFAKLWRDINSEETLLDVAAKRMESMSVAREMMDWAESHAEKTRSPLDIVTNKPLLFWSAEHARQRDADRKAATAAMSALRRGVAR